MDSRCTLDICRTPDSGVGCQGAEDGRCQTQVQPTIFVGRRERRQARQGLARGKSPEPATNGCSDTGVVVLVVVVVAVVVAVLVVVVDGRCQTQVQPTIFVGRRERRQARQGLARGKSPEPATNGCSDTGVVVLVVVVVAVVVVVGTFGFGVGGLGLVGRGACVRVWGGYLEAILAQLGC